VKTRPFTTINFTEIKENCCTNFNALGGAKESLYLSSNPSLALQLSIGLLAKFEISLCLVPK
jgi:hypothetical protein